MNESVPGSNNLSSVPVKTSGSSGGLKIIVGFLSVLAVVLGGVIFWVEKSARVKKEIKLPEVFVVTGGAPTNLALNKTVSASGVYRSGYKEYLVDGNPVNGWNAGGYAPQWVAIDLGAVYSINKLRLLAEGSPIGTVHYDVQGSLDGSTYTAIFSGSAVSNYSTWAEHTFNATSTRYVRINCTNWAGSWVAIREAEVYSPCNPGEKACDGNTPKVCKSDGSAWVDSTHEAVCGSGKVCSGGECVTQVSPTPTPTPTPTPGPDTGQPKIKVGFLGRSEDNWKEIVEVCLKETGKCQDVVLNNNGLSGDLSFEGATVGQTYTIKVKKPGYLTIAKQQALSGTIDMGKMPAGDLDANNQINSLDWSVMKLNFGKDGE